MICFKWKYIEERAKAKLRKRKLYKLGKGSLVKAKLHKRKIANLHRQFWSIVKVVKGSKRWSLKKWSLHGKKWSLHGKKW